MQHVIRTLFAGMIVATPIAAQVPRIPTVQPPPPSPAIAHHCSDDSGCPFPGGVIPEHTNTPPAYPAGSAAGTVRLAFSVTPDGMVQAGSVRVLGQANADLAAAATQAAAGWEFTVLNARHRTAAIPVRLTVEFARATSCPGGGATAAWGANPRQPRLIVTGC